MATLPLVGRTPPVAVLAVLALLVAVAVAVAAASRGDGNVPQTKPSPVSATRLGDDDANLMRRLQRDKAMRSHK